jgi:transmembrane sensor
MSQAERKDPANSPAEDALRWFVRLQSGGFSENEQRAFHLWLEESDAHRSEFDRIESLWADLDQLRGKPFPVLEQAVEYWHAKGLRPSQQSSPRRPLFRLSVALAAMLAVVVAGTYWWTFVRAEIFELRTATGEQRTVTLPDGSTITLNTNTSATVRLSGMERQVVLKEGEIWVAVAHETRRPFEVVAGSGTIRDIGTQFTIRKLSDRVTVTVVEGIVEVTTPAARSGEGDPHIIAKGHQLWYANDGQVSMVESVDTQAVTAWVQGKLVFRAVPLAEVLREVGRYRNGRIQIVDPSLADLLVSGVFNSRDLDSFLHALESAVPVKATRVNQQLVILEHAKKM